MAGRIEVQKLLEIISKSALEALEEYEKNGGYVPSVFEAQPHPLDVNQAPLRLKKAIRTLEGACDQLCTTLSPPLHTVVNVSAII